MWVWNERLPVTALQSYIKRKKELDRQRRNGRRTHNKTHKRQLNNSWPTTDRSISSSAENRQVNILIDHKKLQNFVFFWWFYVRLGLVYNILKVGQNWDMGKCLISKMTFVGFPYIVNTTESNKLSQFSWQINKTDISIHVFRVNLSYESVFNDVESPLIPYLGVPLPQAP